MNPTHDLDRRLAEYYANEAPMRAPDRVLVQALDAIDTTRQRRNGLGRPWAIPPRMSFARLAVGAVAVVAISLFGLTVVRGPVAGPGASPSPSPAASAVPSGSGRLWPQASLDEIRQAQALADAGDPAYTWQVSRTSWYQPGQNHPMSAAFFARFLEEQLGWEAYAWEEAFAHVDGLEGGDVVYVRCAPGRINSLYPDAPCAPTIDESRYETVRINVAQPDREGPSGIWVVTGWDMIEPAEQLAPPTQAEIAASLDPFFQARIAGAGAEDFAELADDDDFAGERIAPEVPLLYSTTTGARYERAEFEIVSGPAWPSGATRLNVRLFAERDQVVVEQVFSVHRDEADRLRFAYSFQPMGPSGTVSGTTEDGTPVPLTYGFLGGAVTYRAAHPLAPSVDGYRTADRVAIDGLLPDDDVPRRVLVMVADPRPFGSGCEELPTPDAQALARSIGSDPAIDATAPVEVTIGGSRALWMDVVLVQRPGSCSWSPFIHDNATAGIDRARIYLVDVPGGSGRVLAIATITDEDSFETVLEWATPVVESIEFHAP